MFFALARFCFRQKIKTTRNAQTSAVARGIPIARYKNTPSREVLREEFELALREVVEEGCGEGKGAETLKVVRVSDEAISSGV